MSEKLSAYAAGLAPLSLPVVAGDAVIASRAGTDFQTVPYTAYTLAMTVSLTRGGVEFGTLTAPAENAMQYGGEGDQQTTSLGLNPGTGVLPNGTITEFVLHRTPGQAFGGDYGRWSFTTQGPQQAECTGLFGEFGGAAPSGPFIVQVGLENPPNTFTTFEFYRCLVTSGSSESTNQGAVLFGTTATSPRNQIVLPIAGIGAPGTRDSHAVLWEGKANDGTERACWWRQYVHPTSNAGLSSFLVQQNLNAGGWTTKLTIADTGNATLAGSLTATGGIAAAGGFSSFPRTVHTGGVGGTLATNAFSAQTPVATEVYTCEIFIPANMTITGVGLLNSGTISGNVKVGLCDSAGNVLATSASTAQSGTNVFQRIPFTGTYAAKGPASYYVVVFFDNNTTRPWAHTVGNFGAGVLTGQVYATGFVSNASLAPSTFTTALGPVATLY